MSVWDDQYEEDMLILGMYIAEEEERILQESEKYYRQVDEDEE